MARTTRSPRSRTGRLCAGTISRPAGWFGRGLAPQVRVRVEYRRYSTAVRCPARPGQTLSGRGDLTPAERAAYLESNDLHDYRSPQFQPGSAPADWPREARRTTSILAVASFSQLKKMLHYEYKPKMDHRASEVCRELSSDFAGMSVLFASTMRSHGVPAGSWQAAGQNLRGQARSWMR